LALASAGRSIAARIAMMAMTTSNSINVNAAAHSLLFVKLRITKGKDGGAGGAVSKMF
jgi:hypothetical protein